MIRSVDTQYTTAFSPTEAQDIWDAARQLGEPLEPWSTATGQEAEELAKQLVVAGRQLADLIPRNIQETAETFVTHDRTAGAMLIGGLTVPRPELQKAVPYSPELPDHLPIVRAAGVLSVAITTLLGHPIAYHTNIRTPAQTIVTSSAPVPHLKDTVSLSGTKHTGWHAEAAGLHPQDRPDTIVLQCIIGMAGVEAPITQILPAQQIYNWLDPELRRILSQPKFQTCDGLSPSKEPSTFSILTEAEHGLSVVYASKAVSGTDANAQRALKRFETILSEPPEPVIGHSLQSGEFLIMSNNGQHCRPQFQGFDAASQPSRPRPLRWNLRTFAHRNHHLSSPFIMPRS